MKRWKVTYYGRPDTISALGYAAASWHNFDKRVWERGDKSITLENTGHQKVNGVRRTLYRVTVRQANHCGVIDVLEGTDWYKVVKQAKDLYS